MNSPDDVTSLPDWRTANPERAIAAKVQRAVYVYVALNGEEVLWELTAATRKGVREAIRRRLQDGDISSLKVRRARLTIFGS